MSSTITLLLVAIVIAAPSIIAIARGVDLPAVVAIIGAQVMFPVVGWFVALLIAIAAKSNRDCLSR